MRYEWRSVLEYDDHFRQLQALYGLPWIFESHHMHTTRLIPIAKSGPGVFRYTGGNKRKSNTFPVRSVAGSGSNRENYVDLTSDGRVLCRMFNGPGGCSLFDCKYLHLYNFKVDGQACGKSHPSHRHTS